MSIDTTKFAAYPQTANTSKRYQMEEGVKPAERSRSTATQYDSSAGTSAYLLIGSYDLPLPPDATLAAGVYQSLWRCCWSRTSFNMGQACTGRVALDIDGTTTVNSGTVSLHYDSGAPWVVSDAVFDITLSSDVPVTSYARVHLYASGNYSGMTVHVTPVDANVYFGVKDGETGSARNTVTLTALTPSPGVHASPTAIDGAPYINIEAAHVYADDTIELSKWTDTLKTAGHSASAESTQSVGTVSDVTDSFPALATRRIDMQADATRKPDALTNSYYVLEVLSGATVMGSLTWETRLAVEQPTLGSLNGTSGTPLSITSAAPVVTWAHSNPAATHYQVRVYDASDDSLDHDSGEIAGAALQGSYTIDGSDLADAKTYYVKVTINNGSGGSTWTVDSPLGYFTPDWGSTACKITSHEGSSDTPAIITTQAPTIEWLFSRTQTAYNLSVVDTSDQSVEYSSGWVVSAAKSQALPASELDLGHTYSIDVQIKDLQGNIYSPAKRAWVHVNEASIPAPSLTAEADTDTKTAVTLEWTAPAIGDADALAYVVRIVPTSTGTASYYPAGAALAYSAGFLAADTYTWSVCAVDEHSLESAFAAADTFVVSQSGTAPVCTLMAQPSTVAPLATHWSYTDVDGDAQTDYQVQLASDAGFTTIVEDSGAVASTELHYTHTTTAAGTYYRRARVRTASTDWSAYDDDTVTIVAATTQSADFELFRRHADGILSKIFLPATGVTATRRMDGPSEFSFTLDAFYPFPEDSLEGCYWFDETSGAVAHDIVNLDDLALTGSPAWTNSVLNLAGDDCGDAGELSGNVTIAGAWTAYLVLSCTGASGTLLFLGANADDLNYVTVAYNGAGKAIISAKGGGATKTTTDLTVPATGYICLRMLNDATHLKLKRMDTAAEVTTDTVAATGSPRLAVGHFDGATPGSIASSAKLAALLLYSADVSAYDATIYRAFRENLKYRGLEVA